MKRSSPLPLLLALGLSGCATRALTTSPSSGAAQPATPSASSVVVRDTAHRPASEEADVSLASLVASPIYFTLDSATLAPESRDALEQLAQALRQRRLAQVTVSGHTCELGTTEYNLALGQRRADIVRGYLVRLGVEPERISVVSYGEERPSDAEAPERNRRAELSFRLPPLSQAGEL